MERKDSLLPYLKLRFNLDHPDLEECYMDGYESAKADLSEQTNPYREGSREYEHWEEGWLAGFYDEAPIYPLEKEQNVTTAANDQSFFSRHIDLFGALFRITGALAATAVIGYQIVDLVA